jgi:hypothetical protein
MESLDKSKLFELKKCPMCSGASVIIKVVKTINPNSTDKLNLRECKSCKHWWIDPMPKQDYLMDLYKEGSEFITHKGCKETCSLCDNEIEKYARRFLGILVETKKLNYLEIGVGSGKLFHYIKDRFNLSYGVEPANWKPSDINIVEDINDLPQDIRFDFIILQDVIEHLENPIEMLKKIKELSSSGAIIGSCFPNRDALISRIKKDKWSMIRPVGHLHFFSSKSIEKMFENSGWKLKKKYSYWPAPSALYYIKNFDLHSKNPLKLIGRIFRNLIFNELLLGKDQWYAIGISSD